MTNLLEKEFLNSFEQLSYRHNYFNVFDNFLDCTINQLSFNYDTKLMDRIKEVYSQEERYIFGNLIFSWFKIMDHKVKDDKQFYDFFGNFYESMSMANRKGFAQYFTPEPICKLMAMLTSNYNDGDKVHEPACGSGRLNLAVHSVNNKLFHFSNDIDFNCAKMTALNFFIHGIKGFVTSYDTLCLDKFKGAFLINFGNFPNIKYLKSINEYNFYLNLYFPNQNKNCENLDKKISIEDVTILDKSKLQLSLF